MRRVTYIFYGSIALYTLAPISWWWILGLSFPIWKVVIMAILHSIGSILFIAFHPVNRINNKEVQG